jgi:hypothetical protein
MLRRFPRIPGSRTRRTRRDRRLGCEPLEARQLLASFTVTEYSVDSGTTTGSLRWALAQATSTPGMNDVVFDPTVFDVPRTITLTEGQLVLTDNNPSGIVEVDGPDNGLTINANHSSRVFYEAAGTAFVGGLNITGGSAGAGGGVLERHGELDLYDAVISGNTSTDTGGGVYAYGGVLNMLDVTICGNTATAVGGGVLFYNDSATLVNVTIADNSAWLNGGGVYVDGETTPDTTPGLWDVTVSGNTADNGSGLGTAGGTVDLTNTIVAGNTGGPNEDPSISGPNCVIGGNPMLAPLGDYGGSSPTMPPLPGSPAIGGGSTAGPSTGQPLTDQRGFLRGTSIDIGADQHLTATTFEVAVTGDAGAPDGEFDLRGAVNMASLAQGDCTITFDPSVFSTPQTITLTAGQLVLSNPASTTITGPGANLLTVSGNDASRVFEIAGGTASISGLTITGGAAAGGGGVYDSGGNLSLDADTVSGNSVSTDGGGLFVDDQGTISLLNVTVSGNTAALDGGGLCLSGATATLNNVTIGGNSAQAGGGLLNLGGATLTNVTVSGNSASTYGGGLFVYDQGTMSLRIVTVSGNTARFGAGLEDDSASSTGLTVSGSTISGNTAAVSGGGLQVEVGSNATLDDSTLAGNSTEYGGAINDNGSVTLVACTLSANTAMVDAGGMRICGAAATAELQDTIVAGDTGNVEIDGTDSGAYNLVGGNPDLGPLGWYGGPTQTMPLKPGSPAIGAGAAESGYTTDQRGMPLDSPNPDIGAFQTNPLIVNTTADGTGSPSGDLNLRQAVNLANALGGTETINFGSVFSAGTPQTITLTAGQLVLSNPASTTIAGPGANLLTVSGNDASRVFEITGGTASISGLTISGLTITGGVAAYGGGVYNSGGNLSLNAVTISGNSAQAAGGLLNLGRATLTNATVSGNSASTYGGGLSVYDQGTMSLRNVTVSGNTARFGAGLEDDSGSSTGLTVSDSTISGNTAAVSGGGLQVEVGSTATLDDSTLAGNSTEYGGAINDNGSVTLIACTLSNNFASVDAGGLRIWGAAATAELQDTIVALDAGNVEIDGSYSGSDNLIGVDPLLAPLGNYGGPTQTMPLLPGSPAIGAGTALGAPNTDQRGVARSGHVDIGAFQSQGFIVTITGGTYQSTTVGTAFPNPLSVTVSSAYGEPVAGGVVTFTALDPGASATFTSNPATIAANGSASVGATANATAGVYFVSASVGVDEAIFDLANYAPSGSSDVDALMMMTSGADNAHLGDGNQTIAPATGGDSVPAGAGPVAVADLSGEGDSPLGNGSGVAGESPRQIVSVRSAGSSAAVNARLKIVYDAVHPHVMNQTSGRNRFSFTSSKSVTQKKFTGLLD